MLLAIDIGNSHTVIGLFKEKILLFNWRIQTNKKDTADEIASKLHGLFSMQNITTSDIKGMIIASVVPQMQSSWKSYADTLVSKPLIVNADFDSGIEILTDNPKEVGADRVVNAVAGFAKYSSALIIVDFGTATTFDCVSNTCQYLGGAITPGMAISLDALGQQTAKLPRVDITTPPKNPIGTTTVDAIKSGILFGYGGLVDGLVSKLKEQFHPVTPLVVATGGMATLIAPYSSAIQYVEPMLTLEGLQILHEQHK